jgi:hypothetical protein
MIASHRRSYDRAGQIEDTQHLKTLEAFSRIATQNECATWVQLAAYLMHRDA